MQKRFGSNGCSCEAKVNPMTPRQQMTVIADSNLVYALYSAKDSLLP